MTFNEQNTIENALCDHLVGQPVSKPNEAVAEVFAEYTSSTGLRWKYVHGENLGLYGKQP